MAHPTRTLGLYRNAGAPVAGTNEVQRLTIGGTPTGGTFKLRYGNRITSDITWSATNNTLIANIDAALEALPNIGTGGVATAEASLTAGIGTIDMTFGGSQAKLNVAQMSVAENALTGTSPTLAISTVTAGVTATARGVPTGSLLVDATNQRVYQNTGSTPPVFAEVGAVLTARVALTGTALHAGIVAWQNPHSEAIIIERLVIDVTTVATGACTLDAGVTATDATTTSDTLIDGVDVNAATAVFDSMNAALDSGANAKAQKLASGKWVTFDEKTGDATGLVAVAYIHYIRCGS